MTRREENVLIRKIIRKFDPRPSYYNDKRKKGRRLIFKCYHFKKGDAEEVIRQLESLGILGWQVWNEDERSNPHYITRKGAGIVKFVEV